MPIRLLCFKPHATKLQITLIERSEIYAQIVLNMESSINYVVEYKEITYTHDIATGGPGAEDSLFRPLILKYCKYAILSHTWLQGSSGEVTFGDWNRGEFDIQQAGYQKLVNFCKAAVENHGVAFGWMDTIRINKESSTELDESIRSMYKWYRGADVCITYPETIALSDMPNNSWFTRGWTLQELFAPYHVKFYNADWIRLVDSLDFESDKENPKILKQIEDATTITTEELSPRHILLRPIPISRKMQLAAKCHVTREEDSAYCLMGMFDVSISIAYGEGAERAFSRLLQAVLSSAPDVRDIFNWAGFHSSRTSSLLPSTLQGYLHRSSHPQLHLSSRRPIEPLILTHLGLRVTIVLMDAISIWPDKNSEYSPIGDYHAIANVSALISKDFGGFARRYNVLDDRLLDDRSSRSQGEKEEAIGRLTLGILNVASGGDTKILVPHQCLAVGVSFRKGNTFKIRTETPIIFTLNKRPSADGNNTMNYDNGDIDIDVNNAINYDDIDEWDLIPI